MDCLLCLEKCINPQNAIEINSTTWNEFNVQKIIEQHLWPMIMYKSVSQYLCLNCWEILDEFHRLYIRIERAHINLTELMKQESETKKPTDLLASDLIEHEIVLASTLEVKEEFKDSESDIDNIAVVDDDDDEFKDEEDIPLIHMKRISDSVLDDPIQDCDPCTEDPLKKIGNIIKIRKRKSKSNSRRTIKRSKKKIINEKDIEEKIKPHTDANDIIDNAAASSLIITPIDMNSSPKYFYQARMSISDYDSFIAKHIKLSCNICQEPFEKFDELENHFKETHKKKQCYLICCGTKFRERACLVDHINLHLNPEYFKCEQCSEVPKLRKTYKIHMRIHNKVFGCETCNEKFTSQYLANKHKLTHLPEDEKKFSCEECQKVFESEVLLNSHQRIIHLKKNTRLCEICGQSVLNSETFKRHMEKHEGIKSSVSCKLCGRLVGSKRALKNHMDYMHPPEDNDVHVCHICHKISVNKRALKEHIRRVHSLGSNFKCTLCEKAFKRADHLRDHMATHTGVGTSKCPWCPKVFNANSSMHLHRKKIHPKEWEEERRKRYSGKPPPTNPKPQVNPSQIDNIPLMFSLTY